MVTYVINTFCAVNEMKTEIYIYIPIYRHIYIYIDMHHKTTLNVQ